MRAIAPPRIKPPAIQISGKGAASGEAGASGEIGEGEANGLVNAGGVAGGDCTGRTAIGSAAVKAKKISNAASARAIDCFTQRIIMNLAGFDNRRGSCYKRAYPRRVSCSLEETCAFFAAFCWPS